MNVTETAALAAKALTVPPERNPFLDVSLQDSPTRIPALETICAFLFITIETLALGSGAQAAQALGATIGMTQEVCTVRQPEKCMTIQEGTRVTFVRWLYPHTKDNPGNRMDVIFRHQGAEYITQRDLIDPGVPDPN